MQNGKCKGTTPIRVRIWCMKENPLPNILTAIQSAVGTTDIVSLDFNPGPRKHDTLTQ